MTLKFVLSVLIVFGAAAAYAIEGQISTEAGVCTTCEQALLPEFQVLDPKLKEIFDSLIPQEERVCRATVASPECQQVYDDIKHSGESVDKYKRTCSSEEIKDPADMLLLHGNRLLGCSLGLFDFAIGDPLRFVSELSALVVTETQINNRCNSDIKYKKLLFMARNASVPKDMRIKIPSDKYLKATKCGTLQIAIAKLAKIKDSSTHKNEGVGLLNLAKNILQQSKIRLQCYNPQKRAHLMCTALATALTTGGTVLQLSKLNKAAGLFEASKTANLGAATKTAAATVGTKSKASVQTPTAAIASEKQVAISELAVGDAIKKSDVDLPKIITPNPAKISKFSHRDRNKTETVRVIKDNPGDRYEEVVSEIAPSSKFSGTRHVGEQVDFPEFMQKLGVTVSADKKTVVRPADAETWNAMIAKYNAGKPKSEQIAIRFKNDFSEKGVSEKDFIKDWINEGTLPVNQLNGDLHVHDIGFHAEAAMFVPEEVIVRSKENFKVIDDLMKDPMFAKDPKIPNDIYTFLARKVDSAPIGFNNLANHSDQRFALAQISDDWNGLVLGRSDDYGILYMLKARNPTVEQQAKIEVALKKLKPEFTDQEVANFYKDMRRRAGLSD